MMDVESKLSILEDIMDIDKGKINEDTILSEIEEWDSMAVMALIAITDDNFHKKVTKDNLKSFKTINDILVFWE